jgi:hypothetical protein
MLKIITRRWWNPEAAIAQVEAQGRSAGLQCAELIYERAVFYSPVESGFLRSTIHLVSSADGMSHWVIATAPYAEPQEFGFIHWLSGRRIPAKAYMRRAVRDGANAFPRIIGETRVRQGFHRGAVMGAEIRAR